MRSHRAVRMAPQDCTVSHPDLRGIGLLNGPLKIITQISAHSGLIRV